MNPYLTPELERLFAEQEELERRQQERLADPEYNRRRQEYLGRMFARRDRMGGYTSTVKQSPKVEAIIREAERRLREEG
jgi:hypothetical protein